MADRDEIAHQQELLAIHRRTLDVYIKQRITLGAGYAPPGVINGIAQTRSDIRRIKAYLRANSAAVADLPDDDEAPAPPLSEQLANQASGPIFHINGPITAAALNLGGTQQISEVKPTMGDTINISHVSGSIVNVKSKLDNVVQSINGLPNADAATKQQLEALLKQLSAELQKPEAQAHAADVEKAATRAGELVDEAQKAKPDKEKIEFTAESLKKAAANIATVLPAVLGIATQIVQQIQALVK